MRACVRSEPLGTTRRVTKQRVMAMVAMRGESTTTDLLRDNIEFRIAHGSVASNELLCCRIVAIGA